VGELGGMRCLLFFIMFALSCSGHAAPSRRKSPFIGKVLFTESIDSHAIGQKGTRKLRPGSLLFIGEKIYSRSGRLKLRLREGNNEIFLSEQTQIRIDHASATGSLNGTQVTLGQGAARFIVNARYSGHGSDRFRVKTPTATVEALGTVFVVSYDSAAQLTTTATLEGSTITKSLNPAFDARIVRVGLTNSVSTHSGASEAISILRSETAKAVVSRLAEGSNFNLSQIRVAETDSSRAATLRDRIENSDRGLPQSRSLSPASKGRGTKEQGSDALEKLLIKALGI
jgi:hypothetical protein